MRIRIVRQVDELVDEIKNSPQEISELLDNIVRTAIFDAGMWGKYTSTQIQQLYSSGNDMNVTTVRFTKPQADEQLLAALTEGVRSILSAYLIPGEDSIPNKLIPLVGGVIKFEIFKFAQFLILAAAILGPLRATQMLFEWAEDKPIRHWQHVALDGVSVEQPLELNPSVRLTNLPGSLRQIPRHVPSALRGFPYSDEMYVNRARLSVEYETAFLSILPAAEGIHIDHKQTSIGVANFSIHEFCESLALACNQYVSWLAAWSECGDWDIFKMGGNSGSMNRIGPGHSMVNMSHDQLVQACKLFVLRQSKGVIAKRLNIAIARWVQSKRGSANFVDRFIDLRIALEALYLPDVSGESRFRVSTYGAWHLGEDFSTRSAYQKTLRDAYDLASRGAHAGDIPFSAATRELLANAQDLCREGILKRLREGSEPNWNELILGGESGTIP